MSGTLSAVRLAEVSKRYGRRAALDGVSLDVPAGGVFGIVGPNGAGKSTAARLLAGLEKPTMGSVIRAPMQTIGYCPQAEAFYPELTARENLQYAAMLNKVPRALRESRANTMLRRLELEEQADDDASLLSGGMQRRLTLGLCFVHEPQLAVVEEPEAGLDPWSLGIVRNFLSVPAPGQTVVLVSHDLEGVARLCSQVALLEHGRVQELGPAAEVAHRAAIRTRTPGLPVQGRRAKHPKAAGSPMADLSWGVAA